MKPYLYFLNKTANVTISDICYTPNKQKKKIFYSRLYDIIFSFALQSGILLAPVGNEMKNIPLIINN